MKVRKSIDRLTKHQLRLMSELEEVVSLVKLDFQDIEAYEREARTPLLELMRKRVVIGEVVTRYTLVDELLNSELCRYFFGRKQTFIKLWRTKRFRLFNHHVIEELSLMAKLRFIRAISKVPKPVVADIERLNALRNGLAHSFFPKNLKRSRPEWKGRKIFTLEGLQSFLYDMAKIDAYFLQISPEDLEIF